VQYMRATAALHDFLASAPPATEAARAFSLLAVSYRRLRDLDVWSLSRLYEEACIRSAPNTDVARACFARYVDEVRVDEVGNSGDDVPRDVAAHVEALRALAGAALP
jgi:hypothetical protein